MGNCVRLRFLIAIKVLLVAIVLPGTASAGVFSGYRAKDMSLGYGPPSGGLFGISMGWQASRHGFMVGAGFPSPIEDPDPDVGELGLVCDEDGCGRFGLAASYSIAVTAFPFADRNRMAMPAVMLGYGPITGSNVGYGPMDALVGYGPYALLCVETMPNISVNRHLAGEWGQLGWKFGIGTQYNHHRKKAVIAGAVSFGIKKQEFVN